MHVFQYAVCGKESDAIASAILVLTPWTIALAIMLPFGRIEACVVYFLYHTYQLDSGHVTIWENDANHWST